jgi:hypothetical protein
MNGFSLTLSVSNAMPSIAGSVLFFYFDSSKQLKTLIGEQIVGG